jgi:hypothetical protein
LSVEAVWGWSQTFSEEGEAELDRVREEDNGVEHSEEELAGVERVRSLVRGEEGWDLGFEQECDLSGFPWEDSPGWCRCFFLDE